MTQTLTLFHNGLALMGWPAGSRVEVLPGAEPEPYDVVWFECGGVLDIGVFQPSACGGPPHFYGARVYQSPKWRVLGVALGRLK